MQINTLKLTNYRNHKSLEIDFDGKTLTIKGNNGTGKSNILEAINLISTTKSLRASHEREVINFDENFALVEANITNEEGVANLEIGLIKNQENEYSCKKIAKLNKTKKSLKEFTGYFSSVLFTPSDIDLIVGPPSLRRKYLDSVLFQFDQEYKSTATKHSQVLKRRNKILELICETGSGLDQLDYWDTELLETGLFIQTKRSELLSFIQDSINSHSERLNSTPCEYSIIYKRCFLSLDTIKETRSMEIRAKKTLAGPQRDDIQIFANNRPINTYGSRGEQRTAVLALKLCEIDFLQQKTGQKPVLLLDDIYSELDPLHKTAIDRILKHQQTIITTASESTSHLEYLR